MTEWLEVDTSRCIECEALLNDDERLLCDECEFGRVEAMYSASWFGHTHDSAASHQP